MTRKNSGPQHLTLQYDILHGRYPVLGELLTFVRIQCAGVFVQLKPRKRYCAADIMGQDCWALLTRTEQMLVGSVISHLAAIGEFPLVKQRKRTTIESNTYVLDESLINTSSFAAGVVIH